ncbi:hypothetical protein [Corynebacterium freiburgense]|uniref:hypothetical protein n=1 Tax=Corynebacterium freiburgense TaxID=556548 RepID=UPI00040B2FAB|nr:hypothetical protein [Corynebacterium freiburgense]WJZ03272.1 hypothetical protein CFREI_09975 [Corynebacterium freiburgense]
MSGLRKTLAAIVALTALSASPVLANSQAQEQTDSGVLLPITEQSRAELTHIATQADVNTQTTTTTRTEINAAYGTWITLTLVTMMLLSVVVAAFLLVKGRRR